MGRVKRVNWSSHLKLASLLRRHAETPEQYAAADAVKMRSDWCWADFLSHFEPRLLNEWLLPTFALYLQEGDTMPPEAMMLWRIKRQQEREAED